MGRYFEELAVVCDEHALELGLRVLKMGKTRHLTLRVSDGAEGRTSTSVGKIDALEPAAQRTLQQLKRAGIVP